MVKAGGCSKFWRACLPRRRRAFTPRDLQNPPNASSADVWRTHLLNVGRHVGWQAGTTAAKPTNVRCEAECTLKRTRSLKVSHRLPSEAGSVPHSSFFSILIFGMLPKTFSSVSVRMLPSFSFMWRKAMPTKNATANKPTTMNAERHPLSV